MNRIHFVCTCLLAFTRVVHAASNPEAKITIQVVDEEGKPVQDAKVRVGFRSPTAKWGEESSPLIGLTDAKGEFTPSGPSLPELAADVSKEGYYYSGMPPFKFTTEKLGRWQPWNPSANVVLKQILKPVPMYARRVEIQIPGFDKGIGFDLEKGDWVHPHGKGSQADFVFKMSRRLVNVKDFDLKLELQFSNEGDGIQSVKAPPWNGSALRLPRHAPETGYQTTLGYSLSRTPASYIKESSREDQNYFFRVRTVLDQKGNVVSALYGKIHGDIRVVGYATPHPIITFTYYLNPDGTRNMEFDPKRNLFKNLKPMERVSAP